MMWVMVVVLSGTPMPAVSWHRTHEACQEHAGVEMAYAALKRKRVEYVACERHRQPILRPLTDEVL